MSANRATGSPLRRIAVGVGQECWWWLSGTGRLVWRYPLRFLAWVATLTATGYQQRWWPLVILIVPVVIIVCWARWAPASYRRWLALPVWRSRKRRWVKRSWPSLMESCGLARRTPTTDRPTDSRDLTPADRVVIPQLRSCRWRRGRLQIVPRLVSGQTVADFEDATDQLRTTMGAVRLRVIPDQARTSCRIVAGFDDPLANPFLTQLPDTADVPEMGSVVLGRTEDDQPWRIDLDISCLTVGCSGAGKGSVMWSLLLGLAPSIRAGLVEVHGIDLKGGMELGLGRGLFTRYADTPAEAVTLLEDAVVACEERARRMAGQSRQHVATVAEPWVLVVIDELASLVAYLPDRDLLRRAETALARLCSIGRAPGFVVFGFLQDPRKETLKARHLFGQTIALRLREREEVAMVLGEGAIAAGAACHHIPRDLPGIGYALDDTGHLTRVRAGYVPDESIIATARQFAAPRVRPIILRDEPVQEKRRSRASAKDGAA